MRLNYINIFSLVCGFALIACEPEIDNIPSASKGEADFSTYVAVGNSLTAGYADNALYLESQQNSFPSIIAGQFAEVGGGAFVQPLVPAGNGSNATGTAGKLRLQIVNGSPSPVPAEAGSGVFDKVTGSFNNFGVPGAKAGDLLIPGYGSEMGNPYFARFASSGTTTILADVIARNPTFFTLWIGNNDVLGYATSGGEGGAITDEGAFDAAIDNIITGLKSSNSNIGGAIANIPDVTKIPYFNTVPWNAFALESQEQVDQLNAGFSQQIETGVRASVKEGVIMNVVTEGVIEGAVTQVVVTEYVFAEKMQSLMEDEHLTQAEATIQAAAYVASPEGMMEIGNLITGYQNNALPEQLQAGFGESIEENFQPTLDAYNAGLLPEEQMGQIEAAIEENYANTLAAYDAELLPEEDQMALTAAMDSVFDVQVTQLKAAGFYPQFQVGPNGFVVEVDESVSPTGLKQLTAEERMLLPFLTASTDEFNPATGQVVVPDKYALDASELAAIETARTAFNAKLKAVAESGQFAYVDIAGFFDNVAATPLLIDGVNYTTTFVTGNIFSLDGIHLTQAGAAIVANEFIRSINTHYNAAVQPVPNINTYDKVTLP